jgi:phospholipid/cholesterol/gamma-HCH transport system substrate-binding protein
MTAFRDRNPVPIGAIGLAIGALLVVLTFRAQDLPLIGGGDTYSAAFTESSGIVPENEVRIAGVKVGKVEDVELAGDHVRVVFRIKEKAHFGTETTASIRIKSVLGAKYLSLEPKGPGQLKEGSEIPLTRTVSAYDVVEAFQDLAETTEEIDTGQLAKALTTMADTFRNTPDETRAVLRGLTRLSKTISSRDQKLRELLANADAVSGVLAARNVEFTKLIRDGSLLLEEVSARREVIHQLLVSTSQLSQQLTGLVADNERQIGPTLKRLNNVVEILRRNQDDLDKGIQNLAVYVRLFGNTVGTGRWFDNWVINLTSFPLSPPAVGAPVREAVVQP